MHGEEVLVVMGKSSVTSRSQCSFLHFIAEHLTMKSLSVEVRTHLSPPKMNYWLLENFILFVQKHANQCCQVMNRYLYLSSSQLIRCYFHHTIPHSHEESFGLTTVVLASHVRGNGAHGNLEYLTNWMGIYNY